MSSLLGAHSRARAGSLRSIFTAHTAGVRWLALLLLLWLLLPTMALAADTQANPYAALPVRKAGLWEVTIQAHAPPGMGGRVQPAMTALQCTDAKSERVLPLFLLPAREGCQRITVNRNGDGHDVSTVCQSHGQRVDMQVAIKGDLQSRYHGTYRMQYPGSPSSNTGQVPFEGRWVGR